MDSLSVPSSEQPSALATAEAIRAATLGKNSITAKFLIELYSNQDVWIQVWQKCLELNLVSESLFKILLGLDVTIDLSADVSRSEEDSKSEKTDSKSQEEAQQPIKTTTASDSSADASEAAKSFCLSTLDFSNLAYLPESLIIAAIRKHGKVTHTLKLNHCYQLKLATAQAIAESMSSGSLLHLSLSGCVGVNDQWMQTVAPALSNLISLDLGYLTDEERSRFKYHITWNQERGDADVMPFPMPEIGRDTLKMLGETCSHLQSINFCGIVIEASAMKDLLLGPALVHRSLAKIDLSYCSRRKHGSMNAVGLELLAEHCPRLVELRFDESLSEDYKDVLQNKIPSDSEPVFFTKMMPKLTDLQDLGIQNTFDGRQDPLSFLSTLSNLRSINFSSAMSPEVFSAVTSNPNLCHSLRSLNGVFKFQNADFDEYEENPTLELVNLKIFSNLEKLVLIRGIHGMIGKMMPSLLQGLPRLNSLTFSGPSFLPKLWALQFQHTQLQSLKLNLDPEFPVENIYWKQFGDVLPCLTRLDLSNNWARNDALRIEDQSFSKMIQSLPHLKSLLLSSGIHQIRSDASLDALEKAQHLEELQLTFTPDGIVALLSKRRSWYQKLQRLILDVSAHNIIFPESLPISIQTLPSWSPSESSRHSHCLFPSVRHLSMEKIATIQDDLWRYLCVHAFANVLTLRLVGDIHSSRKFGADPNEQVDNFKEEGRCEEVVATVVTNLARLRRIELHSAWKRCWIAARDTPRQAPSNYISKKKQFLSDLAAKSIVVLVKFDLNETYRGFGSTSYVFDE